MNTKTQKITIVAMLSALAFAAVTFGRVPMMLFLKYDPKDIVIAIGGLIWGPVTAFLVSLIVSTIEMFTISDNGVIGWVMNLIASSAFACTAAIIYKKKRTLSGAVIGLVSGSICMTLVMLLWNYLITPLYMGVPRKEVIGLLLPVILPFNLIKTSLNAAFTMLLYKPVVNALIKSNLVTSANPQIIGKRNVGTVLMSLLVIATGILIVLSLKGII